MANYRVYDLLQKWARETPDAFAILAPGRPPLTYTGLYLRVNQAIAALHSMGIGRGDRVAIVLPNGPEMAVTLLAVASAATCAPLNPSYRSGEFESYISDIRAKALIVQTEIESPAIAVAQDRSIPVIRLSPVRSGEAGAFTLVSDIKTPAYIGTLGQPDDVALALHTSGTTGRPKLIPLTQSNLCVSAENIKMSLGLSNSDRCLNVMPLFHVHGLIGALLSTLTAGGSIFCTTGFNAARFVEWMEEFEPTWYTAVPAMHQSLLARLAVRNQVINKSSLRFIRSCSSALPPQVMTELEKAFGVPVVEAYGMTEASHQIAINPLPPGLRKPSSVGLATGQQVGIMDDKEQLLPPFAVGEVVVRGDNVTGTYEQDGAVNPSTIAGGWLRTGDLGFMDTQAYLFLRGRIREMINRGGEKISPRDVEDVILSHPAVAEVVAFAVNDTNVGQDVGAAIVLRPGCDATKIEIQEFVANRLADFKVPRYVVFLDAIPKGATGKAQRTGLAEKLGLVESGLAKRGNVPSHAIPTTTTEKLLGEIWQEVLGLEHVGMHDNFFFDLGGDSLRATEVVMRIAQATGMQLSGTTLLNRSTVASLAEWIDSPAASSRVALLQPMGSNPPLFCLHGLAGDVFEFVPLANCLAPDRPVYGLQAHTDGGSPMVRSVEEMGARYVEEIRSVQQYGPYFLTGHSSGGTIAFEVAQRLKSQGESVALLALIDCVYPGYIRSLPSRSWKKRVLLHLRALLRMELGDVATYIRQRIATINDRLGRKIWQSRLKYNRDKKRELSGSLLNIRELNRLAIDEYKPQSYSGRVVLLRCVERRLEPDLAQDLGWSRSVLGGVEVHEVPGDHVNMLSTHVVSLSERLKACLADACETGLPATEKELILATADQRER